MNPAYTLLPEHMQAGMLRWIENGVLPGDFLQAVLRNEFAEAVSRADTINGARLISYAHFLYTAPPACWGSKEKVEAWAAHKGLSGIKENQS
jgi:hypothetical protein